MAYRRPVHGFQLALLCLLLPASALARGTLADYARADGIDASTRGLVVGIADEDGGR